MAHKLSVDEKPGYLHLTVTGENSPRAVIEYMREVVRACTVRNCWTILIEERLSGNRLGMTDVFDIASRGGMELGGRFDRIAYVDALAPANDLMRFAETVAVNRGLPLKVFRTVDDAERWLQSTRTGRDHQEARP
jgi:hypothetical protein